MKSEGTQASRFDSPVEGPAEIPGIMQEDPFLWQYILVRLEFC